MKRLNSCVRGLVLPMMYLAAGWFLSSRTFLSTFSSRYLEEEVLRMKLLKALIKGFLFLSLILLDLDGVRAFSLSSIIDSKNILLCILEDNRYKVEQYLQDYQWSHLSSLRHHLSSKPPSAVELNFWFVKSSGICEMLI